MFATNDHLFAVSGGSKYVIINAEDIYKPTYVSEYRHPNARLHDLWVHDGIAYSAQGGVGTVVVDVGNGKYGGSLKAPEAHQHGADQQRPRDLSVLPEVARARCISSSATRR